MSGSSRARVITEALGGSKLSLAAQSRALPAALQPWRPQSAAEWKAHVERCRGTASNWSERLKGALNATGAAADRIARVAAARGVVVTTGQQPGLFGGPLYTLAKALTALELADTIEKATGVPVAPVFWAATDDADFDEAAVASVSDADGLHEMKQTVRPAAGTPMADAPLGDVSQHVERLRAACASAAHTEFFEMAAKAYAGRATTGSAYVAFLRELLEPLGIAVLDASSPAYRDAARPFLLEALKNAEKVSSAAHERAAALRSNGFEPQVEDDDRGLSLVFVVEKGIKRRLPIAEAGKVAANAALAPNVLLRPVTEREILPTIAYVGGPGEIAYFSQADAVAAALGRERLSVVPRWSCTVIEPFVERALARLGVQPSELKELHALEKRLAQSAMPANVAAAWKTLNDQLQSSVQGLARAVQDAKLMPPPVIEGLSRSLAHRMGRSERRLLAAVKRRDDAVRRDLAGASAALWPRGNRQERVLNFVPLLAREGAGLLDDMRSAARDHAKQLVNGPGNRS
jgi:bacillithiol biosynthesis cysteine-adding enzyme BshC